jgi:aspartate/methionine/tyrosine aminotransferase
MTGWRLGWSVVPPGLREAVDALAGNAALCPPTLAQVAALGAFTERSYAEADARVERLADARRLVLDSLDRLGWGPVAPAAGAFYLWAGIGEQLGDHPDSVAWCRALLDETGVALVPGTDSDSVDGGAFVRLSFAAGPTAVAEAIERIVAFQGGESPPAVTRDR